MTQAPQPRWITNIVEWPHVPHPWRAAGFGRPGDWFGLGRLLAREPEYAALWRATHDLLALERAGLIDDRMTRAEVRALENPMEAHAFTTPLPDVAGVDEDTPVVVLLATGSFAPFHDGHRTMMRAAEQVCVDRGWHVAAHYMSPSHDLYVARKDAGRCADYPANLRLDLMRAALVSEDQGAPILVDPWEALVAPRAVNFTTVRRRLARYLAHHTGRRIRVVCVFGADNADFADVFADPDDAVCVGRTGFALPTRVAGAPLAHPASSTMVRRAAKILAHPNDTVHPPHAGGTYLLRDEGSWATAHWADRVPQADLDQAWMRFGQRVRHILEQAFVGQATAPTSFAVMNRDEQLARVHEWARHTPVVSLDVGVSGGPIVHWPRSRTFAVCGHQHRSEGWVVRPGYTDPTDLPHQAVLVDDDTATGGSLARATAELRTRGVDVLGTRLLVPEAGHDCIFDVVDLRDFLPGARDSGLVVGTAADLMRVPYMAPFVDLATRARIPQGHSWGVSARLWTAAQDFFAGLPTVLTVADMAPSARTAALRQHVDPALPLSVWCGRWAGVVGAWS